MKVVIGYFLAGIGLLGLAINSAVGREQFKFLKEIGSEYILVPAVVLIVFGIVIMIMNSKSEDKIKHVTKEVPIYQGEGKKRKIIGYRVN